MGENVVVVDVVDDVVVVVVNLPLFSSSKDSQLSLIHTTQTSTHPSPTYTPVMAFLSNYFHRTFLSNIFFEYIFTSKSTYLSEAI
jgi:hypothetical protein